MVTKYSILSLLVCFLYAVAEGPTFEKAVSSKRADSAIFYIEGNTGSGKTTLLRAIAKKNPEFVTLEEPVEDIQNVEGINALQLMYEDLNRWSVTVNLLYYIAHIHHLKKSMAAFPGSIIVSDRSIYSGLAFNHADHVAGAIHPLEKIVYERLVEFASSSLQKPHGFIYVRTKPETSFARISKRNRAEEAHISADYWKLLHEGHEWMLLQDHPLIKDIPVLVIDYDGDADTDGDLVNNAIDRIEAFIQVCMQKRSMRLLFSDVPSSAAGDVSIA